MDDTPLRARGEDCWKWIWNGTHLVTSRDLLSHPATGWFIITHGGRNSIQEARSSIEFHYAMTLPYFTPESAKEEFRALLNKTKGEEGQKIMRNFSMLAGEIGQGME
ncbi:hypothetical protein HHX47_DHR6000050 [Lentinula edodes]|nr:hypothetical protein HHX47_DHR6000050 [Lentinula edodes]